MSKIYQYFILFLITIVCTVINSHDLGVYQKTGVMMVVFISGFMIGRLVIRDAIMLCTGVARGIEHWRGVKNFYVLLKKFLGGCKNFFRRT
jgi:hypothetical protein